MKKMLKRGLCFVLMLMMMTALLPVTAYAKVDGTGKPLDLANKLVVSIYTTEGTFPGEPATHGSDEYISFNSRFAKTTASGQFKSSAESELDPSILGEDVLIQGTANGNNTVWGVFSADGLGTYFKSGATINVRENELKMIDVVFDELKLKDRNPEDYEIIWYVIKLQHSSSFWGGGTTEWHIDGLIREKATPLISINYYGNGNTTGSAPDGVTNHEVGKSYIIEDSNMTKRMGGVTVDFLAWCDQPDGSGTFYEPGTEIFPEENMSLYAM